MRIERASEQEAGSATASGGEKRAGPPAARLKNAWKFVKSKKNCQGNYSLGEKGTDVPKEGRGGLLPRLKKKRLLITSPGGK